MLCSMVVYFLMMGTYEGSVRSIIIVIITGTVFINYE